jgi:hypothetical protein
MFCSLPRNLQNILPKELAVHITGKNTPLQANEWTLSQLNLKYLWLLFQESGDEDDKTKIIKILPKKSQTVTQAHMCNYCNYTSPKR